MTKKTKKAAKKPRPKTVTKTYRQWRVVDSSCGDIEDQVFPVRDMAADSVAYRPARFCAARVTITYEVRR